MRLEAFAWEPCGWDDAFGEGFGESFFVVADGVDEDVEGDFDALVGSDNAAGDLVGIALGIGFDMEGGDGGAAGGGRYLLDVSFSEPAVEKDNDIGADFFDLEQGGWNDWARVLSR
jgi:hypothetical protein